MLLFLLGWLRLGALVRYIPVSIVLGFTNGIAVLIALSQLKDLLGLQIGKVPADFFPQVHAIATPVISTASGSVCLPPGACDRDPPRRLQPLALALGGLCVLGLFTWPRLFSAGRPLPGRMLAVAPMRLAARMPEPIVALISLSLVAAWLHLPVETIGTRFGGMPQGLPRFDWPDLTWENAQQLFIPTITIAVLGAIESLLCARVADNLTPYPHHDPNQELMAQDIANFVVPFFGGIPATARSPAPSRTSVPAPPPRSPASSTP